MRTWSGVVSLSFGIVGIAAAQTAPVPGPTFRQVIDLHSVGAAAISPDGKAIAYTVRSTNWKENRFDNEIWLWREGSAPIQMTRSPKGNSGSPRWSPDGRWLGFLADRGDKQQLYVINAQGGEALKLTDFKDGVSDYRWSPDGKRVALVAVDPESDQMTQRKKLYGEFMIKDGDYRLSHLWLLEVRPDAWSPDSAANPKPTRLTEGSFTVGSFAWSPDGSKIAFVRRPNPSIIAQVGGGDLYLVSTTSRAVQPLVTSPGNDGSPEWSPDGQWIVYSTANGDTTTNFFKNGQLAKIPANGGTSVRLAAQFDEQMNDVNWTPAGIWFVAFQKTKSSLFRIDPATGRAAPFATGLDLVFGIDPTPDGKYAAVTGQKDGSSLVEVYRMSLSQPGSATAVTNMTAQLDGWTLGTAEVVQWASRDGAVIEGVLHKPKDFDPSKKYPLLVVIHGGPTGIDFPQPVPFYVYPIPEWNAKGALVLRPNYRGSAGYGEKFRSLNVRNLGVGDLWDVMSGVESLVKRGIVDTTRMGAMGWSQGGYISAFLTTNTTRFKAISVGAGISNWITYYVSTDITPFTRQYLGGTPWNDPAIYAKTSPMTTIKQAKTPTLIQHGEFDQRVPTQNGYELYQGLVDQGVPAKLIIYRGFGHGISKPKEELAAAWHNWQWFGKYIWGEEVQIPLEETHTEASR